MFFDLYSGLMSDINMAQGDHYYEGSQCGLIKRNGASLLPTLINKWAEAGKEIIPAYAPLSELLIDACEWDGEQSVVLFRRAAGLVIQVHMHAYHVAEKDRAEYLECQEGVIRKALQPGWREKRYRIHEWEGGGWSTFRNEERYRRLHELGWGSLGLDDFPEEACQEPDLWDE